MIPFNKPCYTGNEDQYLQKVIENRKFSGDGQFTKKCNKWFEDKFACKKALLTTSCTSALEMSAILINIKEGDEVIMPSFTFVSTANAFALRGAKIVFVDIRPDTMNIDENLIEDAIIEDAIIEDAIIEDAIIEDAIIEDAITEKTKAIVVVHYAGVSCEMDAILSIAKKHNLFVIEDAAQGVMSTYKGKALGTIGDIGTYSFHETKNYVCGEGGAILVNNKQFIERAEIIREKGTNRSKFFRGEVDKYSWVDIGSSYLPSEFNAAYLFGQLEMADKINDDRLSSWNEYYERLKPLEEKGKLQLPYVPKECKHNGHLFYIRVKDLAERKKMIDFLKKDNIFSVFHYVPLHSAKAGLKFGRFHKTDKFTTKESERLLRLPMYYGLTKNDINNVCEKIHAFFSIAR